MLFRRKKDVDLRDLQRRGLIRIPKKEVEIETDRNGFIDLRPNSQASQTPLKGDSQTTNPSPGFFNFIDNPSDNHTIGSANSSSIEQERRDTTRKIEELDNKIYKLEQRIELLERKSGVGSSSSYSWQ
jgi:hypothetical protein